MTLTPLDHRVADILAGSEGVTAVALGGSRASGLDDATSDTDLYAFYSGVIAPTATRAARLGEVADRRVVVESTEFGLEDHFHVDGHLVEVVYLDLDALAVHVGRAFDDGLADEGFTTAFLHTIATCLVIHDDGWLTAVRERLAVYPEATRDRLIATLPGFASEYLSQLRKAQSRSDWPMVVHRRASLQALWFNLLFTVNRRYHPGEKRLLVHADACLIKPLNLQERWTRLSLMMADDPGLAPALEGLLDELVTLQRNGPREV